MGEAQHPSFWTRVWTGLIVGVIACTFMAVIAAAVGLVWGVITTSRAVVWPTLRLIGLMYLVLVPVSIARSVRRPRDADRGQDDHSG